MMIPYANGCGADGTVGPSARADRTGHPSHKASAPERSGKRKRGSDAMCPVNSPASTFGNPRGKKSSSEVDLRSQLHDLLRGNREIGGRAHGIARQEREEALAEGAHFSLRRGEERFASQVVGHL